MNARTMFLVKKREFQCWTLERETAEIARRVYPQLKGGRITNVLQMWPSMISMGSLYKGNEVIKSEVRP